jgi:hypothetical protein
MMNRSNGFHDSNVLRLTTGAVGVIAGAYANAKTDIAKLRLVAARNILARLKRSGREGAGLARATLPNQIADKFGDEVVAATAAQWPCAHRSSA